MLLDTLENVRVLAGGTDLIPKMKQRLFEPSEIVNLIQEVEHPNFQTMFDFCHAYMVTVVGSRQMPPTETLDGGLVELAAMLKDRIGFEPYKVTWVWDESESAQRTCTEESDRQSSFTENRV